MCCYNSQNINNGFSKKPHIFQIGSYLIFIYIAFVQYWLLTPSQEQGVERISCLIISSVLFFSVIISAILAAATDPTDLIVKKYKMSLESGEWFDVSQYRLYCDQCISFVSDTSKHCRRCNRCVQNFDHHCKWINNCIGQYNYKSFLWMIISVMFFSLFELIQQILCIVRLHKFSNQLSKKLDLSPIGAGIISYSALILTLIIFILISNLVFLHIWLITKKMTTYEYIIQLREIKRVKQNQKALMLLSKNKQQEQAIKLEQDKLKKTIENVQKQDQQSDQSSKSGYGDEEFEEQKSNVMNNGGETRKHRTSINNKKEISIYSSTNNKPDKVDHEVVGNLETNRTKKQINDIQNQIVQIANEQQQQIDQQSIQQILEKQETDSIINRSMRKLRKIVSLKMVFPEKELVHVSQPQSRNQSVSSIQQSINHVYNQSDNIFTSKQAALKAPQNSEQKSQNKVAMQYPQNENSIISLKQPISQEQQNKIFKNQSISNVEIQQEKVFFSSMQNPTKKEHELNNRVFSPGKTRQVLETDESFEKNLNLQKKIVVDGGRQNEIQNNINEKMKQQSFEINILDENNQGNSVPLNIQSFQNDNSMLNQLNQTLEENNKTRDKIINYDQTEKDLENQINLQENLLKQDEKSLEEKQLSQLINQNNDIIQSKKQEIQQTIQFKIQSKLHFDDFEQS
ncbi:DHHC zinc finger protein (macronuclear) [Tetrahymena thermophila SB210]|uniref:Palmitoyltransferase n=1 Tax=Tetrahymena thermophila (strain SB210) TaxID=312017 RepID=Q23FU2_TETTS|nr:DHHC zinc finger protein [Tetrahymena thermophila SB210]EAR95518.2 DHHC zinc finger protein [Tetrahymena thermophila SB210]|eukprot:XP_001015763.2 DHHC zinc finger protein [Tetrahymena thermophila SB210]